MTQPPVFPELNRDPHADAQLLEAESDHVGALAAEWGCDPDVPVGDQAPEFQQISALYSIAGALYEVATQIAQLRLDLQERNERKEERQGR